MSSNFDETIISLSEMGFEGVELAGYLGPYENNIPGFLELLKQNDMVVSSAHVSTADLSEENISDTIEKYRALGVDTLILPSDKRSDDAEKIDSLIRDLDRIHTRLQQAGIRFGFHNHDREFTRYSEHTFWDEIAQNTKQDFILQLDIGWANSAGYSPSDMIKKYPMRMQFAHFKAALRQPVDNMRPIIGEDDLNWSEIVADSIRFGGIEWIVVEQEEYPDNLSPLEAVALSKEGIDKALSSQQ